MAKKGTQIKSVTPYEPAFDSVKRLIKTKYKVKHNKWIQTEAAGKKWEPIVSNPNTVPNLPRKAAVAHFRLFTGHDCLAQHLHKIGIKDSPNCLLCSLNVSIPIYPFVLLWNNIADRCWDTRGRMT